MKENGFCRIMEKNGKPSGNFYVDWNRYAKECLSGKFYDEVISTSIAETIITNPPSKQVCWGHSLDWKKNIKSPSNSQELIGAVCRIRNNLFHGGKSGDVDHDRNDNLVREGIQVLLLSLVYCENVRHVFEGNY
ncbi:MAG: hypothetical protein IPL47_17570 [Phyllobacteriaceae bacterium]|nr:hypothetical protein [Phyllobacteriaceae bacterium]